MKEIVPQDSRYIPFTQQKSSCVPASISMVMYKRKIPLVPQELLGFYLGLIVASKNKKFFWNVRTGKKPQSGYGTQLSNGKFDANRAFKKLKIPLKLIYHPISEFTDNEKFKDFLIDAVKKDKDILICFDHGTMNNDPEKDGHVVVLDRLSGNMIRIIDPSPIFPKWRSVNINNLKRAMEVHGDKNHAGFWELKKI